MNSSAEELILTMITVAAVMDGPAFCVVADWRAASATGSSAGLMKIPRGCAGLRITWSHYPARRRNVTVRSRAARGSGPVLGCSALHRVRQDRPSRDERLTGQS